MARTYLDDAPPPRPSADLETANLVGAYDDSAAGLLAAFMAGMAANVSSFNTVFTYDIWQTYIRKSFPDHYYLNIGRIVTVVGQP